MKQIKRIAAGLLTLLMLSGCAAGSSAPQESTPAETEPQITQPAYTPVATASGNSADVRCLARYDETLNADAPVAVLTVSPSDDEIARVAAANKNKRVPVAAEPQPITKTLTAGQLQLYYRLLIAAAQRSNKAPVPDFDEPLWAQSYPGSDLSWEQYYLEQAVDAWKYAALLTVRAEEPQRITEEGYTQAPVWKTYIDETKPAWNFTYRDYDHYSPNTNHQAWLDSLPDTLRRLASELGYSDTDAMAAALFGSTGSELLTFANAVNFSYMYATELSYAADTSAEQVSAYLAAHTELPSDGETTVTIRQLFIEVKNGDWDACTAKADAFMETWHKTFTAISHPEATFANMANADSDDKTTAVDGGLLTGITKGQLLPELEAWCFNTERKNGDIGTVKTDKGIFIVFFREALSGQQQTAQTAIVSDAIGSVLTETEARSSFTVNYANVGLSDTAFSSDLVISDFLYPDVGHQRFPEPLVFLQQDYYTVKFGAAPLHTSGCGITTMAMVATYLGDSLYTPYYCARTYSGYSIPNNKGTDGMIFIQVPPEMNFYFSRKATERADIVDTLGKGQVIVSLQTKGNFTSSGHYLMLWKLTDDGNIVVRDSNLYNYGKRAGHKVDYFTPSFVHEFSTNYWVFQPKIITLPGCSRCGDGSTVPALQSGGYTCRKCLSALQRRNLFLTECA